MTMLEDLRKILQLDKAEQDHFKAYGSLVEPSAPLYAIAFLKVHAAQIEQDASDAEKFRQMQSDLKAAMAKESAMDEYGNPDGTIYIEIRGIYDGISVARLPDGTLINLWHEENRRHAATQKWIEQESSK